MPHAQRVSARTGLDPRLVLAQAALETGYGKHAPDNNYFGIKSHGRKGGNSLQTKEFENGRMVTKAQSFRGYSDPGQSFDDYAAFLERNPRYKPVLAAGSLDDQIAAMGRSGYATDPNYASKLSKIAGMVDGDFTPSSQNIADASMMALGKEPLGRSEPSGGGGDRVLVGGLLGDTMGADMAEYEPERAGGLLGKMFPNMTANRRDEIKMALAGMSLNPNEALVRGLEGRMEGRREDEREFKTQQKAQAQANKTIAFIEAQVKAGKLPPELLQMAQADPASAYKAAVDVMTRQPKDDRTALMQNVEYIMQRNRGMSFDEALQMARSGGTTVNVNGDQPPAPDSVLREELQKDQATSLTAIADAGTKAASVRGDIEALRELAQVAPSGPLEGRFAEMFPEFNDAAAARQAIIKRVAPTLRVEGSGSTSDIEYAGMIEGMGRLTNSPEANVAIADMMLAKSNLDLQRSELVSAYQRGEVPYNDMLKSLDKLNRTSIMPPSLRQLLETTTQGEQNGLPSVGDIVEGHRFNGGDPADPKSWTKVQ
ncbi:glycoside hydrolase family 73 protein [Sulfitobacter sp. 1A13353]|uniref:glycoside hydrolase family 73 protein n=1 Tax=Sulfitobacter sp. 1A13353 TaxID=3368568 RepID=UPI003747090D